MPLDAAFFRVGRFDQQPPSVIALLQMRSGTHLPERAPPRGRVAQDCLYRGILDQPVSACERRFPQSPLKAVLRQPDQILEGGWLNVPRGQIELLTKRNPIGMSDVLEVMTRYMR